MGIGKIEFKELKLPKKDIPYEKHIYYIIKNRKSEVLDFFRDLDDKFKGPIKDLIIKIATVKNRYYSKKIRYGFTNYNKLNEIKQNKYRFFFFSVRNIHVVFYEFNVKPGGSGKLSNDILQGIDNMREHYEQEFIKSL